MDNISTFIYILKKTFSFSGYKEILKKPFSWSFKFFLAYWLLFALLNTLLLLSTSLSRERIIVFAGNSLLPEKFNLFFSYLNLLWPLTFLALFLMIFFSLTIPLLIFLAPFSLITLILAKKFSLSLSYSRSFQLGLHLSVFYLTLASGFKLLGIPLKNSLPAQAAFMFILSLLVLRKIKQ